MPTQKRKVTRSPAVRSARHRSNRPRVVLPTYDANRAKFPTAKLRRYDGQWAAFAPDGTKIVASAASLEALEAQLALMGENAEHLTFERIEFATTDYLGAVELL